MTVKFIVDNNVGKLAKWLRVLGYDALFINPIADDVLVEIAHREGRVVLTKDTQIARRRLATSGEVRVLYVEGITLREQLAQVVRDLHLDPSSWRFSRCLECNEPLIPQTRADAQGRVPAFVFQTQTQYMGCPRCGRLYWRGTHWSRMKNEIERLQETPENPAAS